METLRRIRGDNYPIEITFSVNDKLVDLTGSTLTFSYKNANNAPKSIVGTPTEKFGTAIFVPSDTDFLVAGTFDFDVQRVAGGYTYTHLTGILLIKDDVTP